MVFWVFRGKKQALCGHHHQRTFPFTFMEMSFSVQKKNGRACCEAARHCYDVINMFELWYGTRAHFLVALPFRFQMMIRLSRLYHYHHTDFKLVVAVSP